MGLKQCLPLSAPVSLTCSCLGEIFLLTGCALVRHGRQPCDEEGVLLQGVPVLQERGVRPLHGAQLGDGGGKEWDIAAEGLQELHPLAGGEHLKAPADGRQELRISMDAV